LAFGEFPTFDQAERRLAGTFVGQENRHAPQIQGFHQPLAHRHQHQIEVGLGAQFGGEIGQGAAVVVALAVKAAVETLLDPVPQRMEQQRRRHNRNHPSRRPQLLQLRLHHAAQQEHHAVKSRQQCRRRERIGRAAADEHLDVHQAVSRNCVRKGQRDQAHRENRQAARCAGNLARHERSQPKDDEG
jgi:hypothetical protein